MRFHVRGRSDQIRDPVAIRHGPGQRRAPAPVDRSVALRVGVDDPDQNVAPDPAADRPQAVSIALHVRFAKHVEPQRRLLTPVVLLEAHLVRCEGLHAQRCRDRFARWQRGRLEDVRDQGRGRRQRVGAGVTRDVTCCAGSAIHRHCAGSFGTGPPCAWSRRTFRSRRPADRTATAAPREIRDRTAQDISDRPRAP